MTGKVLIAPKYEDIKGPLLFLAGPIQGARQWQNQAIKIIQSLNSEVNIASPRRNVKTKGDFTQAMYNEQVDWESRHLKRAGEYGTVLFWLAKEFEHNCKRAYAQTSRKELFEWKIKHERDTSNLVVGIEEGFTGNKYILRRFSQDCPDVPILSILEKTCKKAVELAYRRFDREFGKLLMEKYLGNEKQKRKHEHSKRIGQFAYKVASRIKERNPEMDIDPELAGFLGYVHDIGFFVSPFGHESHTYDILTKKENIHPNIANKAAMHGQLAEQIGEKEGNFEKYLPIGLEGMILTYSDMTINTGYPIAIDDRAAGIIRRVKKLNAEGVVDDKFRIDLIENMHKALPRFHRYEQVILALAGAESFGEF